MLVFLFSLYPGLKALDRHDLLPGPFRAPVRSFLDLLDGELPAGGRPQIGDTLPQLPADTSGYLIIDCPDVGQALCVLIRQGEHAMLFDCGEQEPGTIRGLLRREDLRSADMLWLSHADADHINAVPSALSVLTIPQVFISPGMEEKETTAYDWLWESIRNNHMTVCAPAAGDSFSLGDAKITVLGPVTLDEEIPNNNCLVLRVEYGDTSVLLCADAQEGEEMSLLSSGADLRCDVLQAGHHGSNTSSCSPFLREARPSYALISCGEENDYGHPGEYALKRLREIGAGILRTDRDGDLRLISDGKTFTAGYTGKDHPGQKAE